MRLAGMADIGHEASCLQQELGTVVGQSTHAGLCARLKHELRAIGELQRKRRACRRCYRRSRLAGAPRDFEVKILASCAQDEERNSKRSCARQSGHRQVGKDRPAALGPRSAHGFLGNGIGGSRHLRQCQVLTSRNRAQGFVQLEILFVHDWHYGFTHAESASCFTARA